MKVVAAVMIVSALWAVLGGVLGGCSSRQVSEDRRAPAGEAWVWESLDRDARLAPSPALPDSHPLARLGRAPSQSA
jgi:hypothetical protein